jgi:hypothetical protein
VSDRLVAVANAVLAEGVPRLAPEAAEPGGVWPLASFTAEPFAAVLFLRRWKDGTFHHETLIVERAVDGSWDWKAEGGSSWLDDPFERPVDGWEGLHVPFLRRQATFADDDRGVMAIAGAASGSVHTVTVRSDIDTAACRVTSPFGAFIVLVEVSEDELDEIRLEALDVTGAVIDVWSREDFGRRGPPPGELTVAQAVAQGSGPAIVHGALLVVPGEPARLCDDLERWAWPPRPDGPSLAVEGLHPRLLRRSWDPERPGGVSGVRVRLEGTIENGVLTVRSNES